MSEQTLLPSSEEPPEPVVVAPTPPKRNPVPWLYALGFIILAAAIIYLWQYPQVPSETRANAQAVQTLGQRLADIDARVSKLEQRPAPDLGKITAQLDALQSKVADQAQLAGRLDAVSAKLESMSGRDQTAVDAAKTSADAAKKETDALTTRVAALESSASNAQAISTRLNRIAKLQEASFALELGRPVGDIPDAPPALARYAHVAPPTQAQLLLRFRSSEQAALAAPQPEETSPSFVERAWDRAQGLMTIRRGNDVVVGNAVAIKLNKAQASLDAGDLAGAVAAVETLKGQPAEAMANWLADAKGLLDARAALDQMAGQA